MSTSLRTGEIVPVTALAMAQAVKGQVWGVPDNDGTMYDAEFTGEIDSASNLLVKIKRKSEKQPK